MSEPELTPDELRELEALDAELEAHLPGHDVHLPHPPDPGPDQDPHSLADFFEGWEFFGDAVWTGTVMGLLLGLIGVYIVQRRMIFLSAAVSQTASLGVVLTYLLPATLGLNLFLGEPLLGAFVVTAAAVLLVATGPGARSVHRDGLLGFIFLVGAAGTLAGGTRIVQDIADVKTLLLGTAVAVLPEDFEFVLVLAAVLVPLHLWWRRGFVAVSLDRAGASVRGLPVRTLETVLWLSIAAAIAVSTRVLGAMPTFAFSVLPAMAAAFVAPNVPTTLLLAAVLGAAAGFVGYVLAFVARLPVGASQTLTALAVLAAAWLLGRLLSGRSPSRTRSR